MVDNAVNDQLYSNERLYRLASCLVVAGMMACMALTLVQLAEALATGWRGEYLVVLSFTVAIEAIYARRNLGGRTFPTREWFFYRVAELAVILLAVKIAYYILNGFDHLWLDIPKWPQNFDESFLTPEFIYGSLIMLLVWGICNHFAADLMLLDVTEKILKIEEESRIFESRAAVRERLVNLIFSIGVVMTVFASVQHFDEITDWIELPPLRIGVMNLLVYFLLGLVLLGMTQYSLLRARWMIEHLPINKAVAQRWLLYSFGFILALALISSLLPTHYSVGLLGVLNYAFSVVMAVLGTIIAMFMMPIAFLMSLLARWFKSPEQSLDEVDLSEVKNLSSSLSRPDVPWYELFKSILFWVVFLGLIYFSISYYLKEHPEVVAGLRRWRFFAGVANLFGWLRHQMGGVSRRMTTAVRDGWQHLRDIRLRRVTDQSWRYLSLRGLSPRQRVLFYYHAMLRRGGEGGIDRNPSQTAYEYSHQLVMSIDAADEITALTEGFVEARYSQHVITDQEASRMRKYWDRIRRVFRLLSHPSKESPDG